MRKLPVAAVVVITVLTGLFLASAVLGLHIILDGLGRFETSLAFQHAAIEWRQGHYVEAGHQAAIGSWRALDGGVRWQVAQLYLLQSDHLVRQNKLREAAKACFAGNKLLGRYDNAWMLDYRCDLINLRLDIPAELEVLYQNRGHR